jgi:oxygen-independent coproporphyrinogen-3 oxidase
MNPEVSNLFEKYNVPVPRYTSYPTVPDWHNLPSQNDWIEQIKNSNPDDGISLYIHLPYCETLCTYCGCNTRITVNHKVEKPYIDYILQEWKMYLKHFSKKPLIRELHLGGGTPTFFSPENLGYLIDNILMYCTVNKDAEFSIEGHPRNTTTEHLEILHQKGFTRLSLGIQDFDEEVQKYINRIQTVEHVATATSEARRIGFTSINFDLIYGLPKQTFDTIERTIEIVKSMRPDRIAFYSYAHVPWMRPAQASFNPEVIPTGKEKLSLYLKGRKLLSEAGYTDIGMDHFSLPHDSLYKAFKNNKLHRNFMGYTTFGTHFMIGLGASSISDSGGIMVQNRKTVEAWQESLNRGEFPFDKGHILSKIEKITQIHILNLMCNGSTTLDTEVEVKMEVLRAMENDGLLEIKGNQILMSTIGRQFVRNACAALDVYRNAEAGKRFSQAV